MENKQLLPGQQHGEEIKPDEQETIFTPDITDMTGYDKNLKNARVWLYVIAAMQTAMGIFEYFKNQDYGYEAQWTALGIDVGLGMIFLGLALWSRKKPAPAFLVALILYVVVNVTFIIINPENLRLGIIIKIFVIIALVKGYKDAREYDDLKKSIT